MAFEESFELEHLFLNERKCRSCGKTKNLLNDFYLTRKDRGTLPSAYSYECKECTVKRIEQNRKIMVKFDEYSNMITKQNNRCAVCETLQHGRKYNSFKVDRNSKTGIIRGLICKSCDIIIKEVGDNIHTLENMIKYLDRTC